MKKTVFLLLITLLIKSNLSAQPPIILDHDFDVFYQLYGENVFFTNSTNVSISGEIETGINFSITVSPNPSFSILIKPSYGVLAGVTPQASGSKGTVIRPKPGIGCSPCRQSAPTPSNLAVLLSQTYNEILITSEEVPIIGYTLYDLYGKAITSEKITSTNHFSLKTLSLQKAIYILIIDLENQQFKTIKFFKN